MKIICIGRNYSDHAKEMNAPVPSEPVFFMKPDTALLNPDQAFYFPDFTSDLHFECELVVKIKKAGKHIPVDFAKDYYDEIGIGIDFTARDLQAKCKEKGLPWEISKSFDASAPIGKRFLSKHDLVLAEIPFRLEQNGVVVQRGNSSEMIFSFDAIIAYVSQFVSLKTGDLIYTGTPAGVGPVQIGDQLTAFIGDEKLLELSIK